MRKKVLIFSHGYATQFVDINCQYTRLFDPVQYEVTIAYLTGAMNEAVKQKHYPHDVLFLNSNKRSVRGLKWDAIKKIFSFCHHKKIDIVICHRYKPTYIVLLLSRLIGNPLIIAVMHELGALKSLSRKITLGLFATKRFLLAGVSNAIREDLRANVWRLKPERVVTLYNSIDVDSTKASLLTKTAAREQLLLPLQPFIFGNMGRLVKNKDQTTLLRAFANIHHQCPNSILVILGEGPLEKSLQQLADSLMIRDKVIFKGFVAGASQLMCAFDVLISSSIQEAFGMVLIEAMVAKVPVIATHVNGVPEVIQSSGVLIPPNRPLALATEMLKVYQMETKARALWGEAGSLHTQMNFSTERFREIFWKIITAIP